MAFIVESLFQWALTETPKMARLWRDGVLRRSKT